MPLKVRRLLFSFLAATTLGSVTANAQQSVNHLFAFSDLSTNTQPTAAVSEVQDRLVRARAMVATRQLSAAAHELEKIKKETGDEALQSVVRTMLVNIYLEQPNYDRAKNLLEETFTRSQNRPSGTENVYLPVAGQVIKGAYNQLDRYKKLGFNLSDPKLPAEAVTDLDKWRKMLETVCEQSRQMSLDEQKSAESLTVLEEAAEARGALARDEYEAAAWRNTMEDTRELIANAQNKVTDVDGAVVEMKTVASLDLPAPTTPTDVGNAAQNGSATQATNQLTPDSAKTNNNSLVINNSAAKLPSETALNTNSVRLRTTAEKANSPSNEPAEALKANFETVENNDLVKISSLVEMATRKVNPTYPTTARAARVAGVVKVEVVVDEQGSVAEVKNTEGPEILRRAAMDAVRRWKFRPATRDGQPVRMTGYINFNFAL